MKKNTKILIGVAVAAAIAYAIYYYSTTASTATYPYTDENGITYNEDGSYSYVNGSNVITVAANGATSVSTATPGIITGPKQPVVFGGGVVGGGAGTGIGI